MKVTVDTRLWLITQLMIKVRVMWVNYISLSGLYLLLSLVRYVKIQDVSSSSWSGTGSFQQGNYSDQLHAETAGAVHRVQVVLPSPTAPSSLTWPPPLSPCQDHITPQTWNKIGILDVMLFSRPIPLHWILSRCFLKVLINTQEPRVFIQLRHLEITLKGRQIFRRRRKKISCWLSLALCLKFIYSFI